MTWLRNSLQPLLGSEIKEIEVYRTEIFGELTKQLGVNLQRHLEEKLLGATITRIENSLKYLLWEFSKVGSQTVILSHLGFTGWWGATQLISTENKIYDRSTPDRNCRLVLDTDRGKIYYTDPRLLGKMRLFDSWTHTKESHYLARQAPEAHSPQGNAHLLSILSTTRRKVREVLLDQQICGGVGNYLCCEILHRAGIHGSRKSDGLSEVECQKLVSAINEVMLKALRWESRYWWQVFGKNKHFCARCNSPIIREVWGNRGSYTCQVCQVPDSSYLSPLK